LVLHQQLLLLQLLPWFALLLLLHLSGVLAVSLLG
jgi:hypothetical protein